MVQLGFLEDHEVKEHKPSVARCDIDMQIL
jgi:hypothetical protein